MGLSCLPSVRRVAIVLFQRTSGRIYECKVDMGSLFSVAAGLPWRFWVGVSGELWWGWVGFGFQPHDLTVSTKFDDGIVQRSALVTFVVSWQKSSLAYFHAFRLTLPSNQPMIENMIWLWLAPLISTVSHSLLIRFKSCLHLVCICFWD